MSLGHGLALEHIVDSLAQTVGRRLLIEQHLPFDKNGRRAGDAYTRASLHVRCNPLVDFGTVQIPRESLNIQPKFARVLYEH